MRISDASDAALGISTITGLAVLAQMIFDQQDLNPTWNALVETASGDPPNPGALLNMSMLLQLTGQRETGLAVQHQALSLTRIFKRIHGDGSGLKVLVIVAEGDFMANTPLDFLLSHSNTTVYFVYATPEGSLPEGLPEHDVAFSRSANPPQIIRLC
ncbi:MAG: hypothetical protein CGW95_10470 [Phenylobacterium zucineum]|nr:MAG: hypothetical protein CGW95_10470 [Phenylobacterium zucineum]